MVQRVLLLSISLTGDKERDVLAIENSEVAKDFKLSSIQIRDMVEKQHCPFIFLKDEDGVYSHSLENNTLSIWQEEFSLEDID